LLCPFDYADDKNIDLSTVFLFNVTLESIICVLGWRANLSVSIFLALQQFGSQGYYRNF